MVDTESTLITLFSGEYNTLQFIVLFIFVIVVLFAYNFHSNIVL